MKEEKTDRDLVRLLIELVNCKYAHVEWKQANRSTKLSIESVKQLSLMREDEILDIKKLIIKEINKEVKEEAGNIGATIAAQMKAEREVIKEVNNG